MSIDTKRLRTIADNHGDESNVRPVWSVELHCAADEIDRLREQLAMVQRLKCHRCEGRGRHYHDGICELCMGSGKRVPELEGDREK